MNRRQFISSVVASGAAPMLFNGCVGGFFANRKINVAVVGYGRIAHTMDVPGVQQFTDRCVVTAVCEYDAERAAYGKKVIEERYAKPPARHRRDRLPARREAHLPAEAVCTDDSGGTHRRQHS